MRAIVIEGAGPAFSAGHDLGEMVGRDAAFYDRLFDVCTVMMETIHRVPQPVIAKVHAVATAAGCQLVASCDLAVAAEEATVRDARRQDRALLLDADGAALAGRRPETRAADAADGRPDRRADRRATGGSSISSFPRTEIEAAVGGFVERIARSSPLTVGIGKEAFYRQVDLDEHGAYEMVRRVMTTNAEGGARRAGRYEGLPGEAPAPEWRGE